MVGHGLFRRSHEEKTVFCDFEEEDDIKAWKVLFQRCQRRMRVYMRPNRYEPEMTQEGIIILGTNDEELARYDTNGSSTTGIACHTSAHGVIQGRFIYPSRSR
jgi:hypothetical protein